MRISRRALMAATVLVTAGMLPGCSPSNSLSFAQALADAKGAVAGLLGVVPAVTNIAPNLLPASTVDEIEQGLTLAQQVLGGMDASTPPNTAASTLQTVEGIILQGVKALAAVTPAAAAAFPPLAPYVVIVQAAAALLPGVATFINSVLPAGQTAALTASLPMPTMTPEQARAVLGIPTV